VGAGTGYDASATEGDIEMDALGIAIAELVETGTCAICGEYEIGHASDIVMARWGDHVGQLAPEQENREIPVCNDCVFRAQN
jgi:hypothetical protein